MRVILEQSLLDRSPNYRVGMLYIKGLNVIRDDHNYQLLCHVVDEVRKDIDDEHIRNSIWTRQLVDLGADRDRNRASQIAMIARISQMHELPNINSAVNITNALALLNDLPIGVHNLDAVQGDIHIGKLDSPRYFSRRNSEEAERVQDEFAYYDDENILTRRLVWQQGTTSLVSEGTANVGIPIDSLDPGQDLEEVAKELLALFSKYASFEEARFQILDGATPTAAIDNMTELAAPSKPKLDIATFDISKDPEIIERIVEKSVEDVIPSKDQLRELLMSGRRLKVYQGYDPTADTLHIGHTVMMRKLEDFRKLGHEVIMLIGDFTARIGDPTDKTAARTVLTEEEVQENLKKYKEQGAMIMDIDNPDNPVTVHFNSKWLGVMDFGDVLNLASEFSVQQMMKRDMFQKRLGEHKPIYIHEFMYPLMQGWDSVMMNIDVELGGNDQLFNMLTGRTLIEKKLKKSKFVITGKMLTAADGRIMGKSMGNMIKLSDDSKDIYGKVMGFADAVIPSAIEILTSLNTKDVKEMQDRFEKEPMEIKKELAFMITSDLKGKNEAERAQTLFEDVYQNREFNSDKVPTVHVNGTSGSALEVIAKVLETGGNSRSNSEIRRLFKQNAVSYNEDKLTDAQDTLSLKNGDVIKIGKLIFRVI